MTDLPTHQNDQLEIEVVRLFRGSAKGRTGILALLAVAGIIVVAVLVIRTSAHEPMFPPPPARVWLAHLPTE